MVDRIIWIIDNDRNKLLDAQRKINAYGGMKAMCILSVESLKRVIKERIDVDENSVSNPSLIIINHKNIEEDDEILSLLKLHSRLAGVPLFFMVDKEELSLSHEIEHEEEYYAKGAMVVVEQPLNKSALIRLDNASWQYELSKNYERILQKQISELESAKAIKRLNSQLETRNEFLYRIFGKYFSDELLNIILDKQEDNLIGGERVELAVMFSDLRGFTRMSESLEPEAITELLNCYFGAMSDVIIRYGGTIIEFLGDGILAIFGAPAKNERYCVNAIAAAINMQNAMSVVNDYCIQMGYDELEMGIGVHCGAGFVGNIGTEQMMRYNVLGSVVNICSRIENYSVGGQVLASKELVERVSALDTMYGKVFVTREMSVQAKGMNKPMMVCEVSGLGGDYNCFIERQKPVVTYIIDEEIQLELFEMENKVVSGYGKVAYLKEFSENKVKVEIKDDCLIEQYTDVEIRYTGLTGINNKKSFFDVYAKVTQVCGRELILNITGKSKEYIEFGKSVKNGEVRLRLEWRSDMKDRSDVLVIRCPRDDSSDIKGFLEKQNSKFALTYFEQDENVKVYFYSSDKSIRALEFMDFLAEKYGAVKGDAQLAGASISKLFIDVLTSEKDAGSLQEYFEKMVDEYYNGSEWIFAFEYSVDNEKNIKQLPLYKKKRVSWAYVRTNDIAAEGTKFRIKSLENETGMVLVSSPDTYIMIGCRGEIYNISAEKFEATYTVTDEKFDIFIQMPDYIPEVQLEDTAEYISLDDKAYLCYPNDDKAIYAMPIKHRTKVFSEHNRGEYFLGLPGDYLVIREDDASDIYIIQREIFMQTYEKV